jgi:hypothetical protein
MITNNERKMTDNAWCGTALVVCLCVAASPEVTAQSKSQNAKTQRAWSLKSGPGAPHNILPVAESSRDREAHFLRVPKLSTDYVLGEGDQLDIKVVDAGSLNDALTSLTISNSGEITLPYVGAVRAAGTVRTRTRQRSERNGSVSWPSTGWASTASSLRRSLPTKTAR